MKCKICSAESKFLFKALVLDKYQVDYFKCPKCNFIQTENPYWLNESYGNAITNLDVGLVSRNIEFSNKIEKIIASNFDSKAKFLDYAGGYGLFVRLMRDKGLDFYRQDLYCENLFAKNFDIVNFEEKPKFELITAFEFFEHLENPRNELEKMLEYSDSIIFSTELQPENELKTTGDWWYFISETGQHIALYSKESLEKLANDFGLQFFSYGNLHLFTKKNFNGHNPLLFLEQYNFNESQDLIKRDFDFVKDINIEKSGLLKEANEENMVDLLLNRLVTAKNKIKEVEDRIYILKKDILEKDIELEKVQTELNLTRISLNSLSNSREWKMASLIRNSLKKVFPNQSFQRTIAIVIYRLVKRIAKLLLRFIKKINALLLLFKKRTLSIRPRRKRKINFNSKKIVYIGHSYHSKTKSTEFLIDLLKEHYDVEVVLDESWLGKPYPDLSFIDESYIAVVFFQLLPPKSIIEKIKNENIIYFPMYDQSGRLGYDFWDDYSNLKVMNFSKTLHQKLKKWRIQSDYVQYFPEPQDYIPGKLNEVFFWQRLTKVNFNVISKLFGDGNFKIHIHKAVDPGQDFICPNQKAEKKFNITYSDWFETREQMWDLVKEKGIYVAPREYEGIGMSFLEAMAMGKAVIAVDNPTMNEYIQHGKNGFLFNLEKPILINFGEISKIQRQTHDFMRNGYNKWQRDKVKIVEFIKMV